MTNGRLLVVDDNEDNVAMLSRWLRRRGFTVLAATDGQEAVDAVRAHRPDLVFMDVSMPVMSGPEATAILRSDPQTSGVPIIAVTAHAMASDRQACLDAGCNAVATKPVDFAELSRLIAAHLPSSDPVETPEVAYEQ